MAKESFKPYKLYYICDGGCESVVGRCVAGDYLIWDSVFRGFCETGFDWIVNIFLRVYLSLKTRGRILCVKAGICGG